MQLNLRAQMPFLLHLLEHLFSTQVCNTLYLPNLPSHQHLTTLSFKKFKSIAQAKIAILNCDSMNDFWFHCNDSQSFPEGSFSSQTCHDSFYPDISTSNHLTTLIVCIFEFPMMFPNLYQKVPSDHKHASFLPDHFNNDQPNFLHSSNTPCKTTGPCMDPCEPSA